MSESTYDPASPEGAAVGSMIVLMRIYDVLLAQWADENPEGAMAMHELHTSGKIAFSLPTLAMFDDEVTDE